MEKEEISNNGNTAFIDVTNDLLIEILCRLPPKLLFRFKCVSKAWYNLASKAWPRYLSRQANREGLLPSVSGIFYRIRHFDQETGDGYKYYYLSNNQKTQDENKVDISLSFVPCYPDFRIVDCCNGLILCLSDKINQRGVFYVCNPLMKRWVSLRKLPVIRSFHDTSKLFYDLSYPTHFKVLSLLELETTGEKMLLIFCSNSGKWVQSAVGGEPSLNSLNSVAKRPVLFQQTLCFLSESPLNSCVIALDINKQRPQMIKLPCKEEYNKGSLHDSEGSLYYIPHSVSTFQIWVLKDLSSKEWVLKYEIGMGALDEKVFKVGCCPHGRRFIPLDFDTRSFEFGFCGDYFIFRYHCKLLSFNFATQRVEFIVGLRWWNIFSTRSALYTPGLMSQENSGPLLKNQAEVAQVEDVVYGINRRAKALKEEAVEITKLYYANNIQTKLKKFLFTTTIWEIWNERCKRRFRGSSRRENVALTNIVHTVSTKEKILRGGTATGSKLLKYFDLSMPVTQKVEKWIKWDPPNEEECKINTYASLSDVNVGIGAICRNHREEITWAISMKCA